MGLFKTLFRVLTKSTGKKQKKSKTFTTFENNAKQFCSLQATSDIKLVRHQNDLDRIQKLPIVKINRIIDGDTVIIISSSTKIKVRLDSIDCPEDGQQWGDIATQGLIKLIGGKSVKFESHGVDIYGRTLGTLFLHLGEKNEWQNVNERMVTLGHAWVMRMYYQHLPKSRQQKLNQLEQWAKSKRVGLWKTDNPIPPWRWRNIDKNQTPSQAESDSKS